MDQKSHKRHWAVKLQAHSRREELLARAAALGDAASAAEDFSGRRA